MLKLCSISSFNKTIIKSELNFTILWKCLPLGEICHFYLVILHREVALLQIKRLVDVVNVNIRLLLLLPLSRTVEVLVVTVLKEMG